MMIYCDHCAGKFGYDVDNPKTAKGECELCHRRLGPMNVMSDEDVEVLVNSIKTDIFEAGGFQVIQLKGFPVGVKMSDIEPTLPSKPLSKGVVIFFDSNRVVFANAQTGKKIEVRF